MDHGNLRRLSSLVLLRQDIHSPLLPARLPAASEATLHHLLPHGILHDLLLGRLLHRHRTLQRPQPRMGHNGDDELFRLRQAYLCDWRSGSRRRCHDTRLPHSHGAEVAHLMGTEDIPALRLLGRLDVSSSQIHSNAPDLKKY